MNSNFGKAGNPQKGSVSLNNFDFDFGLGLGLSNNRPRTLNDQKHPQQHNSPYLFPSSSTQSKPASSSWAPNKPSWKHQPSATPAVRSNPSNPTSMVGDIFGKSWTSTVPSGPGIMEKNPNLFGDLVGSALGQGKTSTRDAPLKNAAPVSVSAPATAAANNAFSMGNVANSLPKTNIPTPIKGSNWGAGGNLGSYSTCSISKNDYRTGNLGGPSLKSGAGVPAGWKDPFGSLVDFGSKPASNVNSTASNNSNAGDYSFGAFKNASNSSTPSSPSNTSMGSSSTSGPKVDDFGFPANDFASHKQAPPQSTGVDPLDMLFSSSSASSTTAPTPSQGPASQPFSEIDDWGVGSEFGGSDIGGTTELEGLPQPPAGVTASAAKNKGLDNYKQGQYADAVKWLSWAVVLLEKASDSDATMEVLSCRASCYKEVGEYKKAVADCSKVLEHDSTNVSVLLQRALLYESTEKYKLGAEDLKTVLKIDPSNRLARSTVHRLVKMAE